MKKLAIILSASFTILSSVPTLANNIDYSKTIKLQIGNVTANVNNNDVLMDTAPYIQDKTNSTMIPLRFVSTVLDIEDSDINFDKNTKSIKINKNGDIVEFYVGSSGYKINGTQPKIYDKNAPVVEIKDNRTFVPLRLIKDAFNLEIEWQAETKTAILKEQNDVILEDKNAEERSIEKEVIKLVNEERAKVNIEPLQLDEELMKLSKLKAEDMSKNGYFDHTSPTYGSVGKMAKDNKIDFSTIGENIAQGYTTSEEVVAGWMNSPGHKANILNPDFKYIGVGITGTFWSQIFKG